jgi:Transglycosylase SLT domain
VFHGHDIAFRPAPSGRNHAGFDGDKAAAVRGAPEQWSQLMSRISHNVAFAVGAVVFLAQPVLAHAHSHGHHVASAYRHHDAASAHRLRFARATQPQEVTGCWPFGADDGQYPDRSAARYAGQRHFDGGSDRRSQFQGLVEQQASANGVPASLVHRVIMRESGYNPAAVSRGNYGLMQIRLGTARAMGYGGSAAGLLDAETNMTYAVRYLAGAYRAAGGNENRAVALYARGYNARGVREVSLAAPSAPPSESFFAPADASAARPRWFAYAAPGDFGQTGYGLRRHRRRPV